MPFVRHYENPFLDGLHNYLPEILYGDSEQFGSAAPLVTYIQNSVRNEMDLFSSAQRTFTSSRATPIYPNNPQHSVRRNRQIDISLLSSIIPPMTGNTTLINTLLGLYTVPPIPPMEPVVIRPTREQIEEGTQIEIVDADDENCAICQETLVPGTQARSLRVCDHRFHDGCITTWFQRSVACPTCRHDVRESV